MTDEEFYSEYDTKTPRKPPVILTKTQVLQAYQALLTASDSSFVAFYDYEYLTPERLT